MGYLLTFISLICMVNVGRYTIHGSYGLLPQNDCDDCYDACCDYCWEWGQPQMHSSKVTCA